MIFLLDLFKVSIEIRSIFAELGNYFIQIFDKIRFKYLKSIPANAMQ